MQDILDKIQILWSLIYLWSKPNFISSLHSPRTRFLVLFLIGKNQVWFLCQPMWPSFSFFDRIKVISHGLLKSTSKEWFWPNKYLPSLKQFLTDWSDIDSSIYNNNAHTDLVSCIKCVCVMEHPWGIHSDHRQLNKISYCQTRDYFWMYNHLVCWTEKN